MDHRDFGERTLLATPGWYSAEARFNPAAYATATQHDAARRGEPASR
jgi:hypothetical protein